jgi:uncharacterized membrane protein
MENGTGFVLSDHLGEAARWFEWIVVAVEIFAIGILLIGLGRFLVDFVTGEMARGDPLARTHRMNRGRMELGRHIQAALEVFIVSDIVRTVLHFTLENIVLLGGLVLIRSTISFFLERELRHLSEEKIS